jgi:hypothetical protein
MTGAKKISQPSGNTWETRPKTTKLKTGDTLDFESFRAFIDSIKFSAYRIKGFVKTNRGSFEVSCVNDFAVMNPWPEEIFETEVVLISSVGIRFISELHRSLSKNLSTAKFVIS